MSAPLALLFRMFEAAIIRWRLQYLVRRALVPFRRERPISNQIVGRPCERVRRLIPDHLGKDAFDRSEDITGHVGFYRQSLDLAEDGWHLQIEMKARRGWQVADLSHDPVVMFEAVGP
jgi:hypothetical protein